MAVIDFLRVKQIIENGWKIKGIGGILKPEDDIHRNKRNPVACVGTGFLITYMKG